MSSPPDLTDDFWLVAHDTVNGKSALATRALGTGLATGLLVELLFAGNIAVQDGLLYPQLMTPPPQDAALDPIVRMINQEDQAQRREAGVLHRQSGLDLREWIKYLSIDNRAADLVTNRLSQRGLVVQEQRRKMFGSPVVRFVARDSFTSGTPAVRIITSLQRRELLDHRSLALAALLLATGLHQQALEALSTGDRARLADQLRTMNPMLRELLRCGEQIVGEAVMTR